MKRTLALICALVCFISLSAIYASADERDEGLNEPSSQYVRPECSRSARYKYDNTESESAAVSYYAGERVYASEYFGGDISASEQYSFLEESLSLHEIGVSSNELLSEGYSEPQTQVPLRPGDVNLDGRITAYDARLILRFSAGMEPFLEGEPDINGDGVVTAADARIALRTASKLPLFEAVTEEISSKIISVEEICQNPDYPAGCESVAAVMNLRYYGFDISPKEFIDDYLPTGAAPFRLLGTWYSADPDRVFLGDPASEDGWGIWAKGLNSAVNAYLNDKDSEYVAYCSFTETLDSLCERYIKRDIPVLVWATADMEAPRTGITAVITGSFNTFTWISPNHCLLLVGFDEDNYYFNDPLTGKCEAYDKEACRVAFEGNGSQALIITK